MEERWIEALQADQELHWRQREIEQDLDREHALGREQATGDLPEPECEWPWYADPWWEVQEPEVFHLLLDESVHA